MNKRAKKLATPIGNKACQSLAYLAKTPFVTVPGKTLDTIKENPQSLNKRIAKRLGKLIPEFGLLA